MLADAMTSIKAYLYERAVSPLLGSLIVSWAAWNYRFFFLAVSDLKYAEKMAEIEKFYQIADTHNVLWLFDWTVSNFWAIGVVFPLITSMLYLFVFPFPAEWVYRFSLGRQKVLNDLKNEKQENELLTLEQSKAVRNQLADTEKQFDEQIERKDRAIEVRDREIERLTSEIESLKVEKTTTKPEQQKEEGVTLKAKPEPSFEMSEKKLKEVIRTPYSHQPKTENEFMLTILKALASSPNKLTMHQIIKQFTDSNGGKAKLYLDELVHVGVIKHNSGYYDLPHDVRKMVLASL
ncbi:hypothetical protein [Vibrio campbellii]|nr:hypothetical protein [Vibrio parahaemolyticus]